MTSPKKKPLPLRSSNKINFFGLFHCSSENFPGCFFQKCLDTGITGKLIGMLVVSLLGFTLLIVLNTVALQKIANRNHVIKDISIPQYKTSQYILRSINGFKISLLHILHTEDLDRNDSNVIANQQRLAEMRRMILALRQGGPVLDVAKVSQQTLDVFTVEVANDPYMKELIAEIEDEYILLNQTSQALIDFMVENGSEADNKELLTDLLGDLSELYELVVSITVAINHQHKEQFQELGNIIDSARNRSTWIGLGIAIVLTIATVLYILIIVIPLRNILEKIKFIAKGEGDLAHHIEVKSNDEVGQLAQQLNTVVDNIFNLNSFKAVIEEEESTTDVNQRLANLLQDRYHLHKLFIYELTGSKNNMSIAFASNYDNICSPEILDDSNFCRAKRTGHPISSLDFPNICKQFPHKDRMEHLCIPMIANGRVVGVVQFLCNKKNPAVSREVFENRVKGAARYIKEATPVIEAKRFAAALQEITLRDPMTNLYNRRFLETYTSTLVASTLRKGSNVGILMCDMDFFKEVNDTYGHETGDVVLIKTAEILRSCVRASDIVIRYGGEEFIVLLIDMESRQDSINLAEKIRSTMESTNISISAGTLKKTMSIGVSEFPKQTEGFWEAIKFADIALYQAKDSGRNKVIYFSPEMWDHKEY